MDDVQTFRVGSDEFKILKIRGLVLSSQKHSETRIHTTGGGGYISEGSGYVSSPTVSSQSITCQEFWLKSENKEIPIQLKGYDIPIREGQEVTLIYAGKNGATQFLTWISNHSAGNYYQLGSDHLLDSPDKVMRFLWNLASGIISFIILSDVIEDKPVNGTSIFATVFTWAIMLFLSKFLLLGIPVWMMNHLVVIPIKKRQLRRIEETLFS